MSAAAMAVSFRKPVLPWAGSLEDDVRFARDAHAVVVSERIKHAERRIACNDRRVQMAVPLRANGRAAHRAIQGIAAGHIKPAISRNAYAVIHH